MAKRVCKVVDESSHLSRMFLTFLSGPYQGSYTWFEASIYRFATDDSCPDDSEQAKARVTDGMVWESQDELRAAGVAQVTSPVNGKHTWLIQRNARASSEVRQHTITWTDSDVGDVSETGSNGEEDFSTGSGRGAGFIHSLVTGDRIAIKARALVNL